MDISMVTDLMSGVHNAVDKVGISLDPCPLQKECGLRVMVRKLVQDTPRELGRGPVIKGEGEGVSLSPAVPQETMPPRGEATYRHQGAF